MTHVDDQLIAFPHWRALGLVFIGGALGTGGRYGVEQWLPAAPGGWPWGTFLVNLVGAYVLGLALESLLRAGPDAGWRRRMRLLVGTGFCGGFTTYSTFMLDTLTLGDDGSPGEAVTYAGVTVILGLACAAGGIATARLLVRKPAVPS